MFDHVTCELPMPDGRELAKDAFQTKSLDSLDGPLHDHGSPAG